MSIEEIIEQVKHLPRQEQRSLMKLLMDVVIPTDLTQEKPFSVLDFKGIAQHLADNVDPQDFIDNLRDEWDK